ncbi:major facilitator superfamily transporter protein [Oleoguttula sp. CCFEE 5521]
MARSQRFRTFSLILSNLLIPIAVLVFATGFFPYKPVLPGLATWEDGEELGSDGRGAVGGDGRVEAPFNKVIFMVVDALRSDFVYGHKSEMKFTQSLIRAGNALPFTAHATPPTVTMPRIKAFTTGSVPSFLDLLLNFAESDTSSSLANQDTWLAQLRALPDSKLAFYGDDTWLKLFPPPFFDRSDGTTSFFVSDFTEVDFNVTRHLPEELGKEDWNALVLHYLGLDHIGHKTGPSGPAMPGKQKEMDDVVKMIWRAMEREEALGETLLVLAGDHGMNAGGNHGGSGPGETEPALVFISPSFGGDGKDRECPTVPKEGTEFQFYERVEQSDVVPTLAGLMGFPVPKNSLGVAVEGIKDVLGEQGLRDVLRRNAQQMMQIVGATFGEEQLNVTIGLYRATLNKTNPESCDYVRGEQQGLAGRAARATLLHGTDDEATALQDFLYDAQDVLSSTASSYDIPRMVGGTALALVSVILTALAFTSLWPPTTAGLALTFFVTLYGIMMFASSYVEEEQHFWYWLTPAWLTLLATKEARQGSSLRLWSSYGVPRAALAVPVIALHRIMISWNQTGQKHAGEPDIVQTVFPVHHKLMWVLVLVTYLYIGFDMAATTLNDLVIREVAVSVAFVVVLASVVFKLNFTQADAPELVLGLGQRVRDFTEDLDLVAQARVVFVMLGLASMFVVVATMMAGQAAGSERKGPSLIERLQPLLTLFLVTQTRTPNIPLFLLICVQRMALSRLLRQRQPLTVAVTVMLLSQTTYFAFGGSNSISSIDLGNAYNGIADYNVGLVALLVFVGNWAGAVWWCSAAMIMLREDAAVIDAYNDQKPGKKHEESVEGTRSWVQEERNRLHNGALAAARTSTTSRRPEQQLESRDSARYQTYLAALTCFVSASLIAVMAACTALRTHLFIWTVFSPKYLYSMAWAMGWHLGLNVGMGSLLWWLGSLR